MELMTHLAAIAVGVAIALLFLGGGNKTETKSAPEAPAPSAAAKKKKKKNKKKKASDPVAPAKEISEPVPEPVKETPKPAPPKEEPKAAEEVSAPANGGNKKKKNKKKKNSAAAAATTNGKANAPAPTPAPTPAPKAAASAPKAKPPAPAPAIVPLQPRIVVEEEWATIPKKSKKKKNTVKKQDTSAEATAKEPETAPKASVTVTIDASRVGIIIGPKGATMNAIQEKTGTKLDVNAPKPDEKAGSNQFRPVVGGKPKAKATVVITEGTSEGMQAAKKAIIELANKGFAALLQAESFGESSVAVHPRFLSEIVGTGGKIIKAIQSELDVKLTIPKTDWTPKTMQIGNIEPSVRIGIAGDNPANVKQAKQVVKDICAYHHHPITHPGLIHQEVYVPQEFFHCVIGTRGSEIKHIRGNYKVEVYMPSTESWCVTENVICVGKSNDVEKAISYIKLLMDRDSELREQKYSDEAYGDDSYGW